MSFLKDLGKGLGEVNGKVMGGSIQILGEVTDVNFIREVGVGVEKSMLNTGILLGDLSDGIADIGVGYLEKDSQKSSQGLSNLGVTVKNFGTQVGKSAYHLAEESFTVVDELRQGNLDGAKSAAVGLAKVAAVSVIAIGVIDIVDGLEAIDNFGVSDVSIDPDFDDVHYDVDVPYQETVADTTPNHQFQVENSNIHHVTPHERLLPNGHTIWVDGDGDTSIDRMEGWNQTNPNYRIKV